jgi:hypothetical protein
VPVPLPPARGRGKCIKIATESAKGNSPANVVAARGFLALARSARLRLVGGEIARANIVPKRVCLGHHYNKEEPVSSPYCQHEDYPCCGCRAEAMADAYYAEDPYSIESSSFGDYGDDD